MAFGVKTNERPGTRAQVRYLRMSASKARVVLDLIRGKHVVEAGEILRLVERDAAIAIGKCLASAVANAQANDQQDPETLFVSACYADEGPTLKRWRPRARGRATRIRKRTCHITIIVSRLPERELRQWQDKQAKTAPGTAGRTRRRGGAAADRRARVARSRGEGKDAGTTTGAEGSDDAADEVASDAEVPGEPTEDTIEAAEEAAETAVESGSEPAADAAADDPTVEDEDTEGPDGEASPDEAPAEEGDK
jgi:large subunit ribosomal protein L22